MYLPDGTSLDIARTRESGIIKKVYYISDFKYYLLSVSKLTRDVRCFISFYPDFWIIQDLHSGKVKGIGKELDSLYNLQHWRIEAKVVAIHLHNDSIKEEDLGVWHGRFGHAPDKVVK